MGLRQHGTQVVICMRRDDTKLSSLAPIDLFHHKLVTVTSLLVGLCLFVFCACCFFGFVLVLFFVLLLFLFPCAVFFVF